MLPYQFEVNVAINPRILRKNIAILKKIYIHKYKEVKNLLYKIVNIEQIMYLHSLTRFSQCSCKSLYDWNGVSGGIMWLMLMIWPIFMLCRSKERKLKNNNSMPYNEIENIVTFMTHMNCAGWSYSPPTPVSDLQHCNLTWLVKQFACFTGSRSETELSLFVYNLTVKFYLLQSCDIFDSLSYRKSW